MSSCISANQREKTSRKSSGQAIIEMAVVVPIGLLLLLAVGYFGRALLERQTLLTAARFAAREAALAATRTPLHKYSGAGIIAQTVGQGNRGQNMVEAGGKTAESTPPNWGPVGLTALSQLRPVPLGNYGWAFMAQHSETVGSKEGGSKTMKFGIGFVLYGARAQSRLAFLEPIRKATAGASRLNQSPSSGLQAPLTVGAAAFMPGELPVNHGAIGLMDSNSWIREIISE